MTKFTHLHLHTQYSILDGASNISKLITRTKEYGMDAIAITDHGFMYGVKEFYDTATKAGVKPILGIETYVARRSYKDKKEKIDRSGYHLILLAKNLKGYRNLMKLASYAALEGFYYKPRIDKELLKKYSEGLIASSACLGGEVNQKILNTTEEEAEQTLLWYKEVFGDDYYLELQRHQTSNPKKNQEVYDKQIKTSKTLLRLASKNNVKVIATNDCHFLDKGDAEAHDRLICLNTGKDLYDPKRMRYTKEEYLKTPEEMLALFADIPEVITNTTEISDKIEQYDINSQPIMPDFSLPEKFNDADKYLKHLTYQGAKERWGEMTNEVQERLDFELATIKKMGFPGYFLIVWDILEAARKLDVKVGPGRGSAAGSAVAFCIKITDIDPIKYNLLFERFLNPDRISMPDIDIDFDDDGREKVLEWIVNKYGKAKVAHIITFGSMAAKMAIKDVARVQKLPLADANYLSKLVPETPGITLEKAYKEVPELAKEKESDNELKRSTLKYASELEGAIRQTGVHACGVIIGRNDLIEHLPLCLPKDAKLISTQYEGKYVEDIGMLKIDLLGLKTLSIIKDCVTNIKLSKGVDVDIDAVAATFDDPDTFALFSKGETTGIFQFESNGMKKYLRQLHPSRFEDLVAMSALYRPGPMEYIPSFIKRKHGQEKIEYDHPMMEEYLEETYGINVFQEQVMLLSRKLADFTRGQADTLRKAMGKKIKSIMEKLKNQFIEGCLKNNKFTEECKKIKKEPKKLIEKIWNDWESFSKYAFNKSHSVSYAYLSYQTAYLKAHYPAEFMATVLNHNFKNMDKITLFMDECKRMRLKVLVPDINESYSEFVVNQNGQIRFGISAIKGIGKQAINDIIQERKKNGKFKDIFELVERLETKTINKKNIESLALSGSFDSFGNMYRNQYVENINEEPSFIEEVIRYAHKTQKGASMSQPSLFGDDPDIEIQRPLAPKISEWQILKKLNKEKELVGIYLSAHPLDRYRFEIENYCKTKLSALQELSALKGREVILGGMVTNTQEKTSKNGNIYGILTLEDFSSSYDFYFFPKDYINYKNFFHKELIITIKGKIQERKFDDNLEVKITKISLLSEIKEKQINKISITLPLHTITPQFIDTFDNLTQNNKGKVSLYFKIFDEESNTNVTMFSLNKRIELSDDLINYFENNRDINVEIK